MKVFNIWSLFSVSCILGSLCGDSAKTIQKVDVEVLEQKALEVIQTSTNMKFLLRAQKVLETRKYDLYNAVRDQLPVMPFFKKKHPNLKRCTSIEFNPHHCGNDKDDKESCENEL